MLVQSSKNQGPNKLCERVACIDNSTSNIDSNISIDMSVSGLDGLEYTAHCDILK